MRKCREDKLPKVPVHKKKPLVPKILIWKQLIENNPWIDPNIYKAAEFQSNFPLLHKNYKDPYKVLGISKGLAFGIYKKRFQKLALLAHPDKNNLPQSSEIQRRIQEAFNKIKEQLNM